MVFYKTDSVIQIGGTGNFALTPEQARRREVFVDAVDGREHTYKLKQDFNSLTFKAGEEFGFDGDLPKIITARLKKIKVAKQSARK